MTPFCVAMNWRYQSFFLLSAYQSGIKADMAHHNMRSHKKKCRLNLDLKRSRLKCLWRFIRESRFCNMKVLGRKDLWFERTSYMWDNEEISTIRFRGMALVSCNGFIWLKKRMKPIWIFDIQISIQKLKTCNAGFPD